MAGAIHGRRMTTKTIPRLSQQPVYFKMVLLCCCFYVLTLTALLQIATAVDYTVGDEFGWSVPSSPDFYSDWVDEVAPFTEGDTLEFNYAPGTDSVLLVDDLDYRTCNTGNPIQEYTFGPHPFVMRPVATYNFISGEPGHCLAGMRLTITPIL
ncbi:unnamed protein product [Sphagnum jensenii]|uniref:Phytocyanin domain-containing protein n=1 Tax=Sphagnum jensenii TaxID=128206 RepID=A0ABP1AZG9_9BRYO